MAFILKNADTPKLLVKSIRIENFLVQVKQVKQLIHKDVSTNTRSVSRTDLVRQNLYFYV